MTPRWTSPYAGARAEAEASQGGNLSIMVNARIAADAGSTGRPAPNVVVADAGWFTTANLFREMPPELATTLLLRCADYRVAWSHGKRPLTWNPPPRQTSPAIWEQDLVLPTGWMKSYPRLGMRPIARAIRRWRLAAGHPDRPTVLVITYPFYLHLARLVRPERLIYLNIDDYRLYWPKSAALVDRLERETVQVADLTVCTSRLRMTELAARDPASAFKVRHLPHGAPSASIPEEPRHRPGPGPEELRQLPRPWIGYVGTLEDRVDWEILNQVAQANPTGSLILVGRVGPDGAAPWQAARRRCLARENVHAIGWRDQAVIEAYNRSFDVGLIPYRTDHPFNIACCPTKIMDYMAAGRPVVATDLPECRLYADVFDVVEPGQFAQAVATRLAGGPDDGRALARWEIARSRSCRHTITRLLSELD